MTGRTRNLAVALKQLIAVPMITASGGQMPNAKTKDLEARVFVRPL